MAKIDVEKKVLSRNDLVAEGNREKFVGAGAYTINLISSPGSGKTTVLEATLVKLKGVLSVAVIEGDVETDNDAARIRAAGAPVEAIVTGGACHLDAAMVSRAYAALAPRLGGGLDLLVIENVGNLVCPTAFDLGENEKVALVSVTEGEDKPLKYPALFNAAGVCLVTKADLLPHLDFDVELLASNIRAVNPTIRIIVLSAKTGQGMDEWLEYLKGKVKG